MGRFGRVLARSATRSVLIGENSYPLCSLEALNPPGIWVGRGRLRGAVWSGLLGGSGIFDSHLFQSLGIQISWFFVTNPVT